MANSKCKAVDGKMVCGALRSGGKVTKSGVYRLHKDEQVFTPQQLKQQCKCDHTARKGKGKKKAACACKSKKK